MLVWRLARISERTVKVACRSENQARTQPDFTIAPRPTRFVSLFEEGPRDAISAVRRGDEQL